MFTYSQQEAGVWIVVVSYCLALKLKMEIVLIIELLDSIRMS